MTELIYLTDSYKKEYIAHIISVKAAKNLTVIILDETIFYPEGGGQPTDQGIIIGQKGSLKVREVRYNNGEVLHIGKLTGKLTAKEKVTLEIDWERRYFNMRNHSAGHIMHEAIMQTLPGLIPVKGEHGKQAFIEYKGEINPKVQNTLEIQTNLIIGEDKSITTRFVTLEELEQEASWVPPHLPKNKPLRIIQIEGYPPIPDGGTQVKQTSEVAPIKITHIEKVGENVRVHYTVSLQQQVGPVAETTMHSLTPTANEDNKQVRPAETSSSVTLNHFRSLLIEMQAKIATEIADSELTQMEQLRLKYFGSHGEATKFIRKLKELEPSQRKAAGMLVNQFKQTMVQSFSEKSESNTSSTEWFDTSLPGIKPPQGHLHIVTQAIMEITRIFERIGFTRVRHPEVDWDYYPFESLNMPPHHPARDEWETFFIEYPGKPNSPSFSTTNNPSQPPLSKRGGVGGGKIVLTPHTSNGQVREMEKGKLPIRMINIAKCYRRQSDVSHVPMFHQFEGLYIDKNVSIGHLSGVFDYFVKQFYGPERKTRLRPFHFQFTEPSFEVDINCAVCLGTAKLKDGSTCRLCKSGWLELGGSGMVHPVVLRNGGIDPDEYNGFAFGWGVERTYMMKSGTKLDDIRLLYSNDVRFLEQF